MKKNIALFLGLALCLFVGCASTADLEGIATSAKNPSVAPRYVILNNSGLASDIRIEALKIAFAGDILKANVSLISKTSSTLNLQYRFSWYNAQGMEVEPAVGTWIPLTVYGKESKTVTGVAPNSSVKEFRIKIRRR